MTAGEPAFRPLGPDDADALAALFLRNDHPDVTGRFDPFPLTDGQARQLARAPGRDRFFVLLEDGEPAGFSMLRGWEEGYEVPSIGILVDRGRQRRGLGTRLFDATIAAARAAGAPAIRLTAYHDNPALAMYRRRGFAERERERDERRVVMRLDLTPLPVAAPVLAGREREYVLDCLDTNWISSAGEYVERFEAVFSAAVGTRHGVACANGTAALHLAMTALGAGPGDEVIVPAFTYVASANPILYCGATPVLVDAEPETLNLDPAAVAAAVTPRTKGIVAVHLYGHPAAMDELAGIARAHGLWLLEDAAEAHGARYRDRPAGSLGDVAAFSFYGNKIVTTGEGGMVVCDDPALAGRIRRLRGQGLDPSGGRYWFPELGFNYRMTNIAAAIGLAQAEQLDWHVGRRREIAGWYRERLAGHPALRLPGERPDVRSAHWMSSVMLAGPAGTRRDEVMALLEGQGIETRPFFPPLHTLPMYAAGAAGRAFPVADDVAARGINLPSGAALERADVERVRDALEAALR